MFRQVKNICSCAIESTQSVVQKPMGFKCIHCPVPCADPEGGFLSNTGPDPLKFSKLPSQHSTVWADDGSLLVIFGSSLP